jgi:hypothetical protein
MEICKICGKELSTTRGLLSHVNSIHKISTEEYYLTYLDGEKIFCKICGIETKFRNIKQGYSHACKKHIALYAGLQNRNKTKEEKEFIEQKRKKNNLEKYGVENTWQREDVKEKRINSLIEHFGVNSPLKSKEIKEKRNESNIKKYGKKSFINAYTEEAKENKKRTCLNKYGVEYAAQSTQAKEQAKQTCLERYGVEYSLQAKEIRSRSKETWKQKYGNEIENPSQVQEIKDKKKNTCLEHFGVEYSLQAKEIRNKIESTNFIKYGHKNPQGSKSVQDKTRKTKFYRYYDQLLTSDRLKKLVFPLFSKEDYTGSHEKYLFKCNKCGNKFLDYLADGNIPRCKICFPIGNIKSKAESEIISFLKELIPNEKIIQGDRSIINPQELDIYIPDRSLAIEYDGLRWHSEKLKLETAKYYHLNKTLRCNELNIKLIHIFEDEWILKNELVKSKLKSILKLQNFNKLFARKCIIKEIDVNCKNEFLETYHIQGKDNSKIKYGAFYKNELVGVMTFGSLRLALGNKYKKDTFELIRFATKQSVLGLASKMLRYFIKHYHPEKIISYADRRWSSLENNLYKSIGFSFIHFSEPSYWYIHPGQKGNRIHRFVFRKSELKKKLEIFDPDLSEWQNMQLNGYTRIWDCGNLKYEMNCK